MITSSEDRKLNGSIAGYYIGDDRITFSGRFDPLADTIANLAETYAIGWYADIQEDNIVWHIVHGVNWTEKQSENNRFILSYGFDTLQSSTLQRTNSLPNVALVAGQGEGVERAVAYIGEGSGLNRGEVYIDARDLENANALPARGRQKLAEYGDDVVFDITLAPTMARQYRTSFDLGDMGTVKAESFQADCVLSEVTEVYEGGGLVRIDTVFGYDKKTIAAAIKRLNSNADTLVKTEGNTTGGGSGGGTGLTDYEGLINKPKINGVELVGNKTAEQVGLSRTGHTHTAAEVSGLPTLPTLAEVATSGSYNDLTDKPTIPEIPDVPTKTSELENDSGFITSDDIPEIPDIPTKTSELENDSGFITSEDVPEIPDIPTKVSELQNDSKFTNESYVDDAIKTAIQAAILDSWGAAY